MTFREMLNVSQTKDAVLDESKWDDIEKVVDKVAKLFKGHSKITGKNSLTIEVDGVIGRINFDPDFKM